MNLGVLNDESGDRAAQQQYMEALTLYRRLGNAGDEALVLHNLGLLEASRGNYPEAAARYQSTGDRGAYRSGGVRGAGASVIWHRSTPQWGGTLIGRRRVEHRGGVGSS
jgi:hypothetical protein